MEDEDDPTPFDAATGDDDEDDDDEELPEVINLADVETPKTSLIPKGTYPGYIDSVEYGLSNTSNQPMLTFVCKFDVEDEDGEPKERTLRYYATLRGDAAGRTKELLMRLAPDLDLETFRPDDADELFGGMEVDFRITIRPDREDRKIKRNNIAAIIVPEDE